MKNVLISFVLVLTIFASGCCSMMSYSGAKQDYIVRVNQQRVAAAQNGQVAGINLLDPGLWEVMAEHPIRTTFCALADAALVGGATYALNNTFNKSSSKDVNVTTTGNGNTVTVNTGDNNSNIGNPNYSTSTETETK